MQYKSFRNPNLNAGIIPAVIIIFTLSFVAGLNIYRGMGNVLNFTHKNQEEIILNNQISGIILGDIKLNTIIADTEQKRVRGLSGTRSLDDLSGMLFIFNQEDYHSIWMKDMYIPIDIIWIDKNNNIVDIKRGATPETYPEAFKPVQKAKYVLEVNSGFTEKYKIKIGDQIKFF